MKRLSFLGASCCAVLSACAPLGPPAPVTNLGAKAAQLRTAFNAHADRVRLILLVSPS
jgi:hypothetical protein